MMLDMIGQGECLLQLHALIEFTEVTVRRAHGAQQTEIELRCEDTDVSHGCREALDQGVVVAVNEGSL